MEDIHSNQHQLHGEAEREREGGKKERRRQRGDHGKKGKTDG